MAKLTLTDITDFRNQSVTATTINNNSTAIEAALENTLSRDGTTPNTMSVDLDMNSNDILNVGDIDASTGTIDTLDGTTATITTVNADVIVLDGVTISATVGATGPAGATGQGVPTGGTAGQVLTKIDGTNYNTEWDDPSGGAGLVDGDYGDIVVSGSGTVMAIDSGVIVNADVNASAAIDATKIADGSVTNAEFQRLDATSSIQTQLDAKQPLDSDLTAIAALTTTAYGRSLLALANNAALVAEVDASFLTPAEGNAAYQPLDSDLTAIAALTSAANKIPYSTGAGTWALADFPASARTAFTAGFSTDVLALLDDANFAAMRTSMGVQALDATLTALAAFNTNGLLVQTAADTFAGRTLTGTAAQITVSNGDGVSGNPTLSLPSDVLIPTVLTVPNTGLHLLDTNASHDLIVKPGSNITADRTLTVTTGDTDIEVDLTDAGSDKIMFWDDSAGKWTALTLGTNLSITGTTIDASSGGFTAASQAEQEAATDNTKGVTPANQQWHPSAAKFWAELSTSGTLNVSYNVTSRTDTGVGDETITIATDFSSANWPAFVTGGHGTTHTSGANNKGTGVTSKAAGSIIGRCWDSLSSATGNAADPTVPWGFLGLGDQ